MGEWETRRSRRKITLLSLQSLLIKFRSIYSCSVERPNNHDMEKIRLTTAIEKTHTLSDSWWRSRLLSPSNNKAIGMLIIRPCFASLGEWEPMCRMVWLICNTFLSNAFDLIFSRLQSTIYNLEGRERLNQWKRRTLFSTIRTEWLFVRLDLDRGIAVDCIHWLCTVCERDIIGDGSFGCVCSFRNSLPQ